MDYLEVQERALEELISVVEIISQCGGRCPNCYERIVPHPMLEHVAS